MSAFTRLAAGVLAASLMLAPATALADEQGDFDLYGGRSGYSWDAEDSEDTEAEGTPEDGPADRQTPYALPEQADAQAFVSVAQREYRLWQAGEVEYTRYTEPFIPGHPPYDWCGMFVGFCATEVGSRCDEGVEDAFPTIIHTPMWWADWYEQHPEAGTVRHDTSVPPAPGDLVVLFGTHGEIVESVDADGQGFWGILGGTSVERYHRELSEVDCIITPNWDAVPKSTGGSEL